MGGTKETWVEDGPAGAPAEARPAGGTPAGADRYEDTGRVLGQGGLGRVDAVVDARLGREVARKRLLRDSAAHRERFLREARVTASLEHAGIVPLYELGADPDGTPWYTMRRVQGRTLGAAIASARSLRDRLDLLGHLVDACQAVGYAHAQGVVHRDLKPDNVMIGAYGETFVVDWGLAVEEEGGRAGGVSGSPAYMSPEQARGEPADRRADVWGLGAMLFEVLVGRPPFDGADGQTALGRLRAGDTAGFGEALRASAAPPELAAIVLRALSVSPEGRYPSAEALAADVLAWQNGARVGAYGYAWWELARQLVRRNPALTAVLVLSAVGLAVAGGRVVAARRQADLRLSDALVALARVDVDADRRVAGLARLAEAGRLRALHGEAQEDVVLGLAWAEHRTPRPVLSVPAERGVGAVTLADGVVYVASSGEVVRYDLESAAGEVVARRGGARLEPQPDGSRLWVRVDEPNASFLLDPASGEERDRRPAERHLALVPRGDRTWVRDGRGVWVRDADLQERPVVRGDGWIGGVDRAGELAIVVEGRPGELPRRTVLVDASGVERASLPATHLPSLAPDGSVAVTLGATVDAATPDGRITRLPLSALARWASALDDGRVAVAFADGALEIWTADGARVSRTAGVALDPAAVTADGRYALDQRSDVLLIHVLAAPAGEPPLAGAGPTVASTTPDGHLVWVASLDGAARALDPMTGEVVARRDVGPDGVRGVAACAGGDLVAADRGGSVTAFTAAGEVRWRVHRDAIATAVTCAPRGEVLAAWADGVVRELGPDGAVLREFDGGGIAWSLRATEDRVLASDRSGLGAPAWRLFDRSGTLVATSAAEGPAYGVELLPGAASAVVATQSGAVLRVALADGAEARWGPVDGVAADVAVDSLRGWTAVLGLSDTISVFAADGRSLGTFPRSVTALAFADDRLVWADPEGRWVSIALDPPPDADRWRVLASAGRWSDAAAALGTASAWDRFRVLAAAGRRAEALALLDGLDAAPSTCALWRAHLR